MDQVVSSGVADMIRHIVAWASLGIELLAAAVIVAEVIILGVQRGTVRYLFELGKPDAYESYKHQLGKALLLGLDLLVAADVVRTVTLDLTVANVGVLGLLVVVRTFLSWAMIVEIEGRWPWQSRSQPARDTPVHQDS